MAATMKAVCAHTRSGPDVLMYEDAPRPQLRSGDALVHVRAAAALTEWQALFEHDRLVAGQRVLVHGAAAGLGSYAVPIARWQGAEVIGTASAGDLAFVRQLGAVELIDHQASAFEEVVPGIDLVLDTVGGDTARRSWAVVRRGGRLVSRTPICARGRVTLQDPIPHPPTEG